MLNEITVGFGITGSFCTISNALLQMEKLSDLGCNIIPILSYSVQNTNTRFGTAKDTLNKVEELAQRKAIKSIEEAEPIGPKKLLDIMVVMPCTGNTLAKLYCGITDTPVTMACKAQLRNKKPVLLCPATNDGLSMNAKNIGGLMNIENVFFLPFGQDDSEKKPDSLIANFDLLIAATELALCGKKLEPQLF